MSDSRNSRLPYVPVVSHEKARDQLRALMEAAPDVVVIVSGDGRIVQVNERFRELFGYTAAEVIGQPVETLLPEALRERHLSHRAKFMSSPNTRPMGSGLLLTGQRKDGSELEVEVSLSPVGTGRDAQIACVIRDADEVNLLKLSLERYHDAIEEEVEKRTNELVESHRELEALNAMSQRLVRDLAASKQEMIEANRRLAQADRLKSAFLATMSHELRTPLNSIIGFTGVVLAGLAGPLNEEQIKQLTFVKDAAQHLLKLINDVLDISKIEAGETDVTLEIFAVRSILERVMDTVEPGAKEKGIELQLDVSPEVGEVRSDPRRYEQIVLNLVNNAIKFTEVGTVRILASIVGERLKCSVEDTGIGIADEHREVLFAPFQQIDSSLSRQQEGTGLGLSITKKLLELLGGEIFVSSEPGKGSVFTFTLPLEVKKEN